MKIGELAAAAGISTDTVRYYEKQGLLDPPAREGNGYRSYRQAHLERLRFVRSAQALGFSLAQIGEIVPRLVAGQFGRAEIEQQLRAKMTEIDAQIRTLQSLKRELRATFDALQCSPGLPVSTAAATSGHPGPAVRVRRLKGAQ